MPPVPVKPGSHEIDGTILGGQAVVTAGEHATEHAVPLITSRPPHPPFQQTRTIEPGEPVPGPPYVIRPTHHEQAGLVIAEDKLGVNDAPRRPWAQFTFEPALGGSGSGRTRACPCAWCVPANSSNSRAAAAAPGAVAPDAAPVRRGADAGRAPGWAREWAPTPGAAGAARPGRPAPIPPSGGEPVRRWDPSNSGGGLRPVGPPGREVDGADFPRGRAVPAGAVGGVTAPPTAAPAHGSAAGRP